MEPANNNLKRLLATPICEQCSEVGCSTKYFYSWNCLCAETMNIVEAQIKLLNENFLNIN